MLGKYRKNVLDFKPNLFMCQIWGKTRTNKLSASIFYLVHFNVKVCMHYHGQLCQLKQSLIDQIEKGTLTNWE